jgi:hypothetical protein
VQFYPCTHLQQQLFVFFQYRVTALIVIADSFQYIFLRCLQVLLYCNLHRLFREIASDFLPRVQKENIDFEFFWVYFYSRTSWLCSDGFFTLCLICGALFVVPLRIGCFEDGLVSPLEKGLIYTSIFNPYWRHLAHREIAGLASIDQTHCKAAKVNRWMVSMYQICFIMS